MGTPKAPLAISEIIYTPAANGGSASAKFTWNSEPDTDYIVEKSTDLKDFVELTDGHPSEGESTSYTDPAPPATEVYYRVRSE